MLYYDIVLINPPWSKLGDGLENLGLGYMAACLRKNNITVKIIDAPILEWDGPKTIEEVKNIECKLIGISVPYQEAGLEILDFVTKLKIECATTHVSIGGIYPSFAYEEILNLYPLIDSVVIGEGEETIVELANSLINNDDYANIRGIAYHTHNGIVRTDVRPSIENLDILPFPERDTIEMTLKAHNFVSIITSRGCYANCSFCSVVPYYSQFGQRYRMRSSENVLAEIEYLYNNFGVRNIMFNDANFIGGSQRAKERARKIAEGILERNLDLEFRIQCRVNDVDEELFSLLKKAGLTRVYLGIESGSQTVLDRFNKDATVQENIAALKILSRHGLFTAMGFIMFDEKMSFNELSENISFLNSVKRNVPKDMLGPVYPLSKLLPLAGTETERDMKERGKYKGNSLEYTYDFNEPVINTLFKVTSKFAKITWSIKEAFGKRPNSDKTWVGGWRETLK